MLELSSKQVQFLAEAVARLQRVAVLWDVDLARAQFQATEHAAQAARLRLQSLGFHPPGEFAALFNEARARQAQALIILSSPSVFPLLPRLADLATQFRLPAISMFPQFAANDGLIGYGPDLADLFRRAAGRRLRRPHTQGGKAGRSPDTAPGSL